MEESTKKSVVSSVKAAALLTAVIATGLIVYKNRDKIKNFLANSVSKGKQLLLDAGCVK